MQDGRTVGVNAFMKDVHWKPLSQIAISVSLCSLFIKLTVITLRWDGFCFLSFEDFYETLGG